MTTSDHSKLSYVLCGKNPDHQTAVQEALAPEFEAIQTLPTPTEIQIYLQNLLSTTSTPQQTKPSFILLGGGFTNQDFETILSAHPDTNTIPWLRPIHTKPQSQAGGEVRGGGGPPPPGSKPQPPTSDVLGRRVRKCVDEHMDEIMMSEEMKKGGIDGEEKDGERGVVWYF